ncbi:myb family transcription factor [Metarhizium robertsii ARSEF 23]|nr:myb family transcription factor [Metarhizium robertsii ARSEF 23]KHO11359.1 myb family transcription factor [Metarhizium robertsii ARSEF 23]
MAGQEEPEVTPISTPLDTDRLHALFSEYEKLVNGQEAPREREGSSEDDEFSCSDQPETRQIGISRLTRNIACEQQRGISKRKTQLQTKATSSRASRMKAALASSAHEYEYRHLGEARRLSNGSIEVEVFWVPTFLPCSQLRGEQAIEEAKNLVTRNFGHTA